MRIQRSHPAVLLLTAAGLAGCPVSGNGADDEQNPLIMLPAGYDPMPVQGPGHFPGVVGVPNLDDDNENGDPDWDDFDTDGENDLAVFGIGEAHLARIKGNTTLRMSLTSGEDRVRVWRGSELVLGEADGDSPPLDYDITADDTEFHVEFSRPLARGTLSFQWYKGGEAKWDPVVVELLASPLVMNTHMQPAEKVMAVEASFGGSDNNSQMIADYQDALGDRFITIPGNQYGWDVWIQDEIEFATYSSPDSRIDLVIDSIRDRGLDDVPEDYFEGPEFLVDTWGEGFATSQDSFGNLEATPPVTVDGVEYPFGRVYYGDAGSSGAVVEDLQEMFADMAVQGPFELDTSWLCVGHVDEFMSWVPDPSAPKGWRLVYTDIPGAWEVLEAMDPDTPLPRYASGHGFATVGEILEDNALRALNDDLWDDYLEPNLDILREKAGVTDEDIVWMPGLFEVTSGCGGTTAALIPGMANLIVSNFPGEQVQLFMADPFLREDSGDQSTDPMITEVRERFSDYDVVFVDDWSVYHMGLGEVHCGTNVIRTPTEGWWRTINSALEL